MKIFVMEFCGKRIREYVSSSNDNDNKCLCNNPEMIIEDYTEMCKSCGFITKYLFSNEYINFHENKYKIKKKSIYFRKYHIINILDHIIYKENVDIQLTYENYTKMFKIFELINSVLVKIKHNRKRIISVKYIFKQILDKILNLSHINVKITKCEKT